MVSLNNFDASVVPDMSFDAIPEGYYEVIIVNSEMKPTKDGQHSYLELSYEVVAGDYKGRRLWDRLCLDHSNEMTGKIARASLASICKAVDVIKPTDSTELHNLPFTVKVACRKREDNGEMANEIKSYYKQGQQGKPLGTPVGAGTGNGKQSQAPWKKN